MIQNGVPEVTKIRKVIREFIEDRKQAKLDKLTPAEVDKRAAIEATHTPLAWLADAARRVAQIQLASHIIKPLHPDARGTNLHVSPDPIASPGLVGTHSLSRKRTPDVVGNAAALDVYKFLSLEHDGRSLLQYALEHDSFFIQALSDDTKHGEAWCRAFASLTESESEAASHTLAKQMYFPLADGGYHKTHLRMPAGGRSTDREDFPAERSAYALRDVVYLEREAHRHGEAIGAYARSLLAVPLPWTRMRRVYALLGLVKRYGAERVEEACRAALAVDLVDVTRLKRVLAIAAPAAPTNDSSVATTAAAATRFLRPTSEYRLSPSLPFAGEQEAGR